ncbi:MAG: 2,3-bisphosphoglycerate-independent phosphoglycerate mutase [Balneolaceae bacterium]
MNVTPSKVLLVILDGLGLAEDPSVSAVDQAETPCLDHLMETSPNSRLSAGGEEVGLPPGQFGNSEVGHLNIGAGRIVWQELSRINRDIEEGGFFENPVLKKTFQNAEKQGKIHLIGLFSDGGVHSHHSHLHALLQMAARYDISDTWVHAITDGRDTSPKGGADYCRMFKKAADKAGTGTIASLIGRYYAMDRDNRWERTELAYRLLTDAAGETFNSPEKALEKAYGDDLTDEFIQPLCHTSGSKSRISDGDTVIFFNIRADRTRQIIKALLQFDEVPFKTDELRLNLASLTSYDKEFEPYIEVAYPPAELKNTLGSWISRRKLQQLRISETEKYPHVTYFFNGGEETPLKGEERVMIPSPKVATYDLQPEMNAGDVTNELISRLKQEQFELVVVNYANPDMVGHTGIMGAAIKAVETVDSELKEVLKQAKKHDYRVLVIADHGNADCMVQPDGTPHTAHTTAPVPAILIGVPDAVMRDGILADVAPTLLKMMGLPQPEEMTGKPLY